MSATTELAALRAFAVAALPLVEHYKARRCSYISEHHVSQVDAAIDAMDLWTASAVPAAPEKPVKFDVLDLIREPDNYTSSERAQASAAISEIISAAMEFDETYAWHWDRVDGAAVIMPDRIDAFEARAERLKCAIENIRGAA